MRLTKKDFWTRNEGMWWETKLARNRKQNNTRLCKDWGGVKRSRVAIFGEEKKAEALRCKSHINERMGEKYGKKKTLKNAPVLTGVF